MMKQETSRSWLPAGWVCIVVCLALNLAVLAGVAASHPEYLRDYRVSQNADAYHYVLLGRNFLLKGEYSRCETDPFVPDVLRTPVYPLFAGALDIVGGAAAIYLAHALLHAASCLLLYRLVRRYLGVTAAVFASLLLATDLMIAVSNFEAMSELLFLFLVLASANFLVLASLSLGDPMVRPRSFVVGGLLLALAILTRPAGLYLPGVFAVVLVGVGLARHCLMRAIGYGTLLLLVALLPVAGWIARNSAVFSLPRLTHNDAIMQVYFAGAGAYQIQHGITLEEAQERISREFDLPPPHVTNNHWISDVPVAQIDAQLRSASMPVLLKYPKAMVVSSLTAVGKASVSHNVALLGRILDRPWNPPGTASLLRAEAAAFDRLFQNEPSLLLAFCWQYGHNMITWLLALVGLFIGLRNRKTRLFSLLLAAVLAYFHMTVALVGVEAFYRSRTPHMPYVFVFAGLAAAALLRRQWLASVPTQEPKVSTGETVCTSC